MSSREWKEFQERCIERHLAALSEIGINTPYEYIDTFDNSNPDFLEQQGALRGLKLHAFYRAGSFNNQQIAVVPTNPRLDTSVDDIAPAENPEEMGVTRRINNAGDSSTDNNVAVKPLVEETEKSYGSYLLQNRNFIEMLQTLSEHTEVFSLPENLDEGYFKSEFFQDIYYTNWWKMASEDDSTIEKFRSTATELLEEELFDIVRPDIVILYGRMYWNHIIDGGGDYEQPEPLNNGPRGKTIKPSAGYLYEVADTAIIPLQHYSRFPTPECFEDSCQELMI